MPEPREGESKSSYISRCVRQVVGEGKEQEAAVGQCEGMWREHEKKTRKYSSFATVMKQTVQGVHQTTALGNQDRKRRSFNEVVAMQSMSTERRDADQHDPAEVDELEQDIVRGVKPADKRWELPFSIRKADPDQRLIYGWASVVTLGGERIIDKQGDIIPIAELERAVIKYGLESRSGGDMHNPERAGVMTLVQGLVFTPELEKLGIVAKDDAGKVIHGWLACYYVPDDDLWSAIKRGERPELSIGGQAIPVESPV